MNDQTTRRLAALTACIGAAFFIRVWAGPGILASPRSDVAALSGPRALERRAFAVDGTWPLWDPSTNSGSPAHASPLTMYLFPFQWLDLLLPLDRATNLIFTLNLLLAGLSMLVCARRFLERPGSALFCAVGYMLSYRYLAIIDAGWLGAMSMYALAPLLAWAADRLLERPDGRRCAAFAMILGLSALQGSAQSFYYALLALAGFVLWRAPKTPKELRRPIAFAFLGAGVLAAMITAPQLLPRLQFTALSTRIRPDYRFFLNDAPTWRSLATLIDPRDGGGARLEYWENNFYFGLWLYPLMLLALWKDRRRSLPLLGLFALTVFLCFDTPLLKFLFRVLPGFALFRRPTRILQVAQFAAALAAGLGGDVLLKSLGRRREMAAAAVLCLLPIADSGIRMLPRLKTVPLSEAFPEPAYADLLRRGPDSGRVAAFGRTAIPYGSSAVHSIDMINGYTPLNLRHYIDYFSVLQNGDPARTPKGPVVWTDLATVAKPEMLRALDVRYIVANRRLPLEQIGYDLVASSPAVPAFEFYRGLVSVPVFLWRDRRPLGPAYFADSLRPIHDDAESLAAVAASTSARAALVLGWDAPAAPDFSGGSARMTRRGENVYAYDVDSRGMNFLILSQVWYPGWRATLDGRPLPLYRTNHALLGCVVPPGRHALALEMTSPLLTLGLALCAAGAAAALWLARANPSQPRI